MMFPLTVVVPPVKVMEPSLVRPPVERGSVSGDLYGVVEGLSAGVEGSAVEVDEAGGWWGSWRRPG